ncbi:hypothetical protein COV49_02870 [Candidatus Falkowbacteria bacterium CG11_big_fil_rev_8_21_14_0_20_39_10]|uniref:Uncharacterized protein n=1 Tax=Candidatus Falkowbacteria bacterium CG11_big_fil_rev_8_21_14_0_20_39_10 TaxID=1974570 RepID=A0A2M6K952_9BACT|nr:MAG: hypothetical protein COV49_02870 [Candidatus Falkowbacteria bacterium CG11_big_fil_rev_8_21_14_0_20_39_10]
MRGYFPSGFRNGGKGGVNPFYLHQISWLNAPPPEPLTEAQKEEISEFLSTHFIGFFSKDAGEPKKN